MLRGLFMNLSMRSALVLALPGCLAFALVKGCAASGDKPEDDGGCTIGSERCACTQGGACDPGLECLSGICVDPTPGTGGTGTGGNGPGPSSSGAGAGMPCLQGCAAVDVVFALDSSASMISKNQALAASGAFQQVVQALATMNCGTIDYRIGVTDDNDRGWTVPPGWTGANPWFESAALGENEIVLAFSGAANAIVNGGQSTPLGCEHVLTSTVTLLSGDTTGFLRTGALLVLVLVTDVDDYGAYDQLGGNSCGLGCSTPPTPVASLYNTLVTLKGSDPAAVGTIIVAGDPAMNGGPNPCGQPQSCNEIFHSTRLWQFAGSMMGMNGYTASLCAGPTSVPTAVQAAFEGNIDLACQQFMPPE